MDKIPILVAVCVFLLATHVQAAGAPADEMLSEDYQLIVTGRLALSEVPAELASISRPFSA